VSSRSKAAAIVIGGVVGAVVGATMAWAYVKSREAKAGKPGGQTGSQVRLKAGLPDYVKIGISLLNVIRQTAELFKPV
jgi:hypothetical protein